jgi:ABC-type phosphate transport system substrate-binding protein
MTTRTRARAAAAGALVLCLGWTVREAAAGLCSSLPKVVYVSGSTAVKPLLASVGAALSNAADPITIVYSKGGSCLGPTSVVSGTLASGTGAYWPSTGDASTPIEAQCDLPAEGAAIDIGASDVFASSCPGLTDQAVTAAGVQDFWGPNQIMTFVAPSRAIGVNNISAEAAYLTMGMPLTGKAVSPWTTGASLAIRNSASGTQTMIGKAIRLDASKWLGTDEGGSSGVVNAMVAANNQPSPQQWLGILSTGETDANRSNMKVLAFQPFGEKCAILPDSSLTSFDKINVRTGAYPIWGPLHLYTKATGTPPAPVNPNAALIIGYFTGSTTPPAGETQLLDLEIANYTVPQCAMKVKRTSEMGAIVPNSVSKPCGCYFEAKVPGGSTSCTPCSSAAPCATAGTICSYGYCEVSP